jgi:hypothetical protein
MKKIITALVIGAAFGAAITQYSQPEPTVVQRIDAYNAKQGGPQALAERFMPKMFDVRPSDIHLRYDFSKTPVTATTTVTPSGGDIKCNVNFDQASDVAYPEYGGWRIQSYSCKPLNAA